LVYQDSQDRDVKSLLRKLLSGYQLYFDRHGVLNSDGRRLLNEIIRLLVYEYPELKPLAKKVRKNPTLSNVVKLAEVFMDINEVRELMEIGIYGPYTYSED